MRKINYNYLFISVILLSGFLPLNDVPSAYAISATGGTITYSGGYTIHTFTSSGNFIVSGSGDVDYLVVGGAGGGANGGTSNPNRGWNGGAGGQVQTGTISVSTQTYSITVGAGGAGAEMGSGTGHGDGTNSVFSTVTATASGGAVGGTGSEVNGGTTAGGAGTASSISGSSVTYGCGGGGGSFGWSGASGGCASAGSGGSTSSGTSGTANTGSAGGGGVYGWGGGGSGASGIVIIKYLTSTPSAPLNPILYTNSTSQMLFDWDAPSSCVNCTGYKIWNATNNSVFLNDTGSTVTKYQFSNLDSGKLNSFFVSAWNATGAGANSTTASGYTINYPPTLTKVNAYNSTAFQFFYTINGTFNGIKIEGESPSGAGFTTILANSSSSTTSYIKNGFNVGIDYNLRTYAHNQGGTSAVSNTITNATQTTSAPTLNTFGSPTTTTLAAAWSAPITGTPTTYTVEKSINNCSSMTTAASGLTSTSYTLTGLSPFRDYCVQIKGVNAYGTSSASNQITNSTLPITYNVSPTNLVVYPNPPSPSTLDLEWVAPSMQNINGYRIQREAPVGGGFSVVVSNTTSSNNYYNNTGLSVNTYYNYKVYAMNTTGISLASNTYSQTTYHLPDVVDDLTVTPTDLISFNLDWTQPDILYGYLLGYNINYTTPEGVPLTVYLANTGDSDTEYEVTGASGGNDYSFRVSAITIHGKNVTGANIANGTAFDSFEIGTLDMSQEGTDQRPIVFSIYPIDSDTSDVVVTYDPALQLACDFRYALAGSNTTYTGLTENVNGALVYSNFTINGINNDIIDIDCWDELDTTTRGQERIGQSTIPIVDQVNDFQDGLYGTSGQFGAFDMMTIIIIIVSMIGFNRTHPYVGVIVMFAVLGFARYYGFIQDITVASGLIILVIALAIAYGRRDNEA